ncbi:MAG: hypothetical protein R3250_02725, partial [Melioribacteraceae bacterium]|nr:hypothetical protein [Melioribacteraceae bacterium]
MLIILTKKDLGRESKRKPVDKLSTWDDFIKHSDRMPDKNLRSSIEEARAKPDVKALAETEAISRSCESGKNY